MTPELKTACEVVFQEHKSSVKPFTWDKDAFRGRLAFGLSVMAKEILVSKGIIYLSNPEKKKNTVLNPLAATASCVEEAEELIQNRVPSFVTSILDDQPVDIPIPISRTGKYKNYLLVRIAGKTETTVVKTKWYMRPLFRHIFLPACAAVAGALIAFLLGSLYDKIFLN
jgi:hypothetical protein